MPITSISELRARFAGLPRDEQREVSRLINAGGMAAAVEYVEARTAT